ncbi:hypothetical protein [Nonomuraea sp. NPDC049758]|uniref:hypothetical protein n=1 Tax=Nonomuraea sp. NPDC049758 TaxID=3154360 RepID=UPI00342888B1
MRETPEEFKELKELLEASLSRSTPHLRSIVTANPLTAEQITRIGTARSAAKARHLAARPAAGAAHMRGDDLGVFTHGTVESSPPRTGSRRRTGRTCSRTTAGCVAPGIDKLTGVSRS